MFISICWGEGFLGQILAVLSGKGGTGKTSLLAGIAACLAMEGERVLCIDLDVGLRNLDIALGMADEPILPFTSIMRGEYPLSQAAKHPTVENLWMLTAPVTESASDVDPAAFGKFLRSAKKQYDWILLDAPAGIGSGFELAQVYADQAILVALADPATCRDAAFTADRLLQKREIPLHLVVNRVNRRLYAAMKSTIDDIMDSVGLQLLGIVPEDSDIPLAAAEGKPLVQRTYRGAALGCLHIARRLLGQRVALMKL